VLTKFVLNVNKMLTNIYSFFTNLILLDNFNTFFLASMDKLLYNDVVD